MRNIFIEGSYEKYVEAKRLVMLAVEEKEREKDRFK